MGVVARADSIDVTGDSLHAPAPGDALLRDLVQEFVAARASVDRVGATASPDALANALEGALGRSGLGIERAWEVFAGVVAPHTFDLDGPRFLAFVPMAPATTAVWMDAAVGAASFSAESWLEAAGAVAAENQALDSIRTWTGMPEGAGGAFCSGGSIGNLSAMAVARDHRPGRRICIVADTAHASVDTAARLLGLDLCVVASGADGRLTATLVEEALDRRGSVDDVAMIVASAGSTNAGVIDDLSGLAELAVHIDAWLHVDGAYGGAALLLADQRPLFAGLERADSFIVDPHKWLFSTSGSCALLYREPAAAVSTHRQSGPYIDVLHGTGGVWNPSDYAFQLTRRASGLPFWFTLAVHGTDALAAAVRVSVDNARYAADRINATAYAETVLDPQLGVVLFRRAGWDAERWRRWATDLAERQVAFVAPTTWKGEVVGRLVFLHPLTAPAIIDEVLATLAE